MKKHKRALSLLLIICIMCCAFFGSVESSSALVLNPWTIALCGSLLVAAGLTFDSSQQMESAVSSFAGSCDASLWDWLVSEAESFKDEYGSGFHFPITEAIVSAISGWLGGVTAAEGGSVVIGNNYSTFDGITYNGVTYHSCDTIPVFNSVDSLPDPSSLPFFFDTVPTLPYEKKGTLYDSYVFDYPLDGFAFMHYTSSNINAYPHGDDYFVNFEDGVWKSTVKGTGGFVLAFVLCSDNLYHLYSNSYYSGSYHGWEAVSYSQISFSTSASLTAGSSIPFDDVWAPGSSDEEKALVPGASVKLPKGLVQDGALDSDVVGTMTPESVRAGTSDIPDVIAGTGTITGTGEGTGIFEGIGSLVLDIPIIGTIASTLSEILEAIKGFFDVSRFDLNFDSLKIGLTKVFPFCIPFDFFNAIKMFSSDASAFVFDINLETEYFTIDHTVDLTPFRLPILFFRYVVVFWFGFILISRTKDFMKW